MPLLDLMKTRRSIRKYLPRAVEREKLEKIVQAALYAPNPGGRQGACVAMLTDAALIHRIGVINADCENRNWGPGVGVSAEQPSIIDDLTIQSGFYGCTALAVICVGGGGRSSVNGIGSAFVCAQNMVLEAQALGVSSCIVGRAQATFDHPDLCALPAQWGLAQDATPMVFVCLGYIDGPYPEPKPRREGRAVFVDE